ncbi:MAG: FIST signal transduction protein [Planctomycetota bacterium]|jgi:small ligand-binding sensory domain FIST
MDSTKGGKPTIAFGSGFSDLETFDVALKEAIETAEVALGPGDPPDLALVFHSGALSEEEATELPRRVRERTGARHLMGCCASGTIGAGSEREDSGSSLSILLARLPGVEVRPFALSPQLERDAPPLDTWLRQIPKPHPQGGQAPSSELYLLVTDPYSIDPTALLDLINESRPGVPILGGLASGSEEPGATRLFVQDLCEHHGAVGIGLSGSFALHTIVSQGCRPVGRHMVITRADGQVIFEVGQRAALTVFREVIDALDPEERDLVAKLPLHVGRVIDENKATFQRGDFLIRNPIAADLEQGAIAVGDLVRAGQTIQLHVRDAEAAEEDLSELLKSAAQEGLEPEGVLMFSCAGRGKRLFGESGHDSALIGRTFGEVPIAGFFCAGEFGPIGGRNFVHGYTSSLALLSSLPA